MMDSDIEHWTGPVEELGLGQFEDRRDLVKEQSTCRSVSGSRAASI